MIQPHKQRDVGADLVTMVKRRTNKEKYRAALAKMKEWIKGARNWPLRMVLSSLRLKLRGYWNYYSVIGN